MYTQIPLTDPMEMAQFTPCARLMAQFKLSGGSEIIDLRTWTKWNTDQEWHPKKNSFTLEKRFAVPVFKKLLELIEAHDREKGKL